MKRLNKALMMLVVVSSCVGCDQVTKEIARAELADSPGYSFLGDLLRLQYSENHGAFLSLGAGLAPQTRFWVFTGAIGVLLLGLLVYALWKPVGRAHMAALSLILGGGIGNLIDRIAFQGGVTDFLNIGIGALRTGIFNVADIAIMAGAMMLFYLAAREGRPARR
jgi:signal peptidase II